MAAALSLPFTATPLAAGTRLVIEATAPVSAGINFQPRSAYKQILVTAAAAASPINALAAYTAKYGALVAGTKIFFRATPYDANGRAGASMTTSVVVA